MQYAIALTGGIGSGKSTVCSLLKLYGLTIIDADKIAKELLEGQKESIVYMFGNEYLNEDLSINRKKLANLIFNDKVAKEKLELFLHPKIRTKIREEALKLEEYKVPYIVDIPLFFETKAYSDIKYVAVVYAPRNIQKARVKARDNLSIDEIDLRLKAQIDIEDKNNMANFVIDNSLDLKHLQLEVEKFVQMIRNRSY